MKCPSCGFVTFNELDRCKRCGTDWVSERDRFGVKPLLIPADRALRRSSETEPVRAAQDPGVTPTGPSTMEPRLDEEFDRLYLNLKEKEPKVGKEEIVGKIERAQKTQRAPWGGFVRRSCAFYIDVAIITALSYFLFYLIYVAYTVGLAAHGQVLTLDRLGFFLSILGAMWISLVAAYFVLLHGMDGRTVGKWLLGLRVVAAYGNPITYGQAFSRLVCTIPSALFGLGFFWILWNREKRGWHDILARTWVIRDLG